MTEPHIRYRKKPATIRNVLLAVFVTLSACETAFIAYEFGQRSTTAYVQEADWLEVVAQAEKPHAKVRR